MLQASANTRARDSTAAGGVSPSEVLQHTQYCHLVPAPGLRTAYDTLLDGTFEDMLREVCTQKTTLYIFTRKGNLSLIEGVAIVS